jgi:hypothetical protein
MATLYTKVKLYLEANSKTWDAEKNNIDLRNDGSGSYIKTWNVSGLTKPNDSKIAEYDSAGDTAETLHSVRKTRAHEYPELKEQLDMQYKDLLNGTTTWKDAIAKVKSDNPKG